MEQFNEMEGKIAEHVSHFFHEPEYLNVRILYVTKPEEADFFISKKCTRQDYLVIGTMALLNSITEKKPEIKVFKKKNLKKETVGLYHNSERKDLLVESELFIQMVKPLDSIYDILYKDGYKFWGIGLSLSTLLMTYYAGGDTIAEQYTKEIHFENFEDTVTAQINVFHLMKNMIVSSMSAIYFD